MASEPQIPHIYGYNEYCDTGCRLKTLDILVLVLGSTDFIGLLLQYHYTAGLYIRMIYCGNSNAVVTPV